MLSLLVFGLYVYLGYKSIRYIKYHIMHVEYELVFDGFRHWLNTCIQGAFLGLITIPVMIIHKLLFNRG